MTLLDDSVSEALNAVRITGKTAKSYLNDNPNEAKSVIAYLKGGSRPNSLRTSMGRHLTLLEDQRRIDTVPIPPAGDKLRWSPKTTSSATKIGAPKTGSWKPTMEAGKDYIIVLPDVPWVDNTTDSTPQLFLDNCNNLTIIGGEMRRDLKIPAGTTGDPQAIQLGSNITGTVHIEGILQTGMYGQGILFSHLRSDVYPECQIQNCHIDALHPIQDAPNVPSSATVHCDAIQSYGGPYKLRVDGLTIKTAGNGFQLQPRNIANTYPPIGAHEYHRINIVQVPNVPQYVLWKACAIKWAVAQSEVWVTNGGEGNLAWANGDNGAGGVPHGIEGWQPNNSLGWPIIGEPWHLGYRPEGDFVTEAGLGYQPPDYLQ